MFATLNNMLKNSSLKIILALAVGMTAGFMLGVSVVSRSQLNTDIQTIKPSQNSAEVKVSLMLDYGDGKVETILDLDLFIISVPNLKPRKPRIPTKTIGPIY